MKIAVVTSFNEKLYDYYAYRFLETYNWGFDLHVYHEGWTPTDFNVRDNIHYHNIWDGKNGNEFRQFVAKMSERNIASTLEGQPDKIIHGTDYKRDAIRFAYKVFAKTDFMLQTMKTGTYDYVFWIDADVTFKKEITKDEVIEKFLPEDYCISFIDRPTYYSECGFVGYNLLKYATREFVQKFREHYTKMRLLEEEEWHDSYLFDCVRKKWLVNQPQYNLSPVIKKVGNPWPDTPMAEYMDHLKGKKRKDAGVMLP